LPLNGFPKLAAVFKLLKTAASFKNGLSQFWLFQKTAASFENGLSQFWIFQKTAASFENGMSQSVLSEYCLLEGVLLLDHPKSIQNGNLQVFESVLKYFRICLLNSTANQAQLG
jgi:hypothetical protein